ncbi:hypothetical protein Q0Z83_048510 [Actinoplanes sichuanensis]|uniref:CHAP domain-containing protein n=1 Tax=Actinoplanes sichuanensis TaxID=512349 RepID=A0ABW4AQ40_9ACTN|nr:CHAP domain-containing protein [Actinoplanes sichuanensis]BEL06660.1 hypothetical protein Q0Z83_048510 [Actinoplanes sichuanensis]
MSKRQLTRSLVVAGVAVGAALGLAVPAQAAGATGYHVTGTGSKIVNDPRVAGPVTVGTLTRGTAITIDCGIRVRRGGRDVVWHHITAPVSGYLPAWQTDVPRPDRFLRGEPTCGTTVTPAPPVTKPPVTTPPVSTPPPVSPPPVTTPPVSTPPVSTPPVSTPPATTPPTTTPTTPAPSTPSAPRGATINYNQGYGGSCAYYALDRFHQLTGVYPKAFGDAKYLAASAASNGWSVGSTPRVDSIVIFQGGQNGAGMEGGHAAWVEKVSGNQIYVAEMNFPNAWTVTNRWLTPVAGVQYIYAS